ncbi:hypothetical protein ES288_D06G131000v1 [Gossypium darwinii]|uniref:MD-2-related lipid-recognition domain-containing protein n=1 Tax=Gossypium darwinii TaxID=34276 RepID=A0A5D2C532_GOSDA|nr:hypothetical protein ES288_D06G131000v1 [Gossypium darwinii]
MVPSILCQKFTSLYLLTKNRDKSFESKRGPSLASYECIFACQAITGGKAVIEVYFFGFHIHQETHDLCEETSCPITVGNFVLSHNQVLPGFTPPGFYKLKMTLSGAGIKQFSCISFDFKISFGASESSVSDSRSAHQVYMKCGM